MCLVETASTEKQAQAIEITQNLIAVVAHLPPELPHGFIPRSDRAPTRIAPQPSQGLHSSLLTYDSTEYACRRR